MYCNSDSNYTHFILEKPIEGYGTHIISTKTLGEWYEDSLSDTSISRPHNEHLVNFRFIFEIPKDSKSVIMKCGKQIEISKRKKKEFLRQWHIYQNTH